MPPRQPAVKKNTVTIDLDEQISPGSGGARRRGNALICDYDLVYDPDDIVWKPFYDLNIEVAVIGNEDRVLVVARRRMVFDDDAANSE